MSGQRFGEILVRDGLLGAEALLLALEAQKGELPKKRRLGQILREQGVIADQAIAQVLSQQYGFPLVDPLTATVDPTLLARLEDRTALRLLALPLQAVADQVVRVAMADPLNITTRRDLEFALGAAVEIAVAPEDRLREAIEKHYTLDRQLASYLAAIPADSGARSALTGILEVDRGASEDRLREGGGRPYVDLVNLLLADASEQRASDIHIEPQEGGVRVRYRVDGVLREVLRLPRWVEAGILSRVKIIASLDIAEKRKAQDGRVRVNISGSPLDLRVSVVPSQFGETAVLRLLDPRIVEADLSALGFQSYAFQTYYRLISRPQGLVLITGPTGSGKSTTLYATINRLRSEQTSICTIEDPIEFTIDGLTQMAVDEKRGMTFAHCIRAMLRQDPNVLIIGEVRDKETAHAACQAALTGHLVLATLHTNDTVSAIGRMRDLEVPSYLLGATLTGIVAQRLVRRLCPTCRLPAQPRDLDWNRLSIPPQEFTGTPHRVGPGCSPCRHVGYKGRVGVYEILNIDETLRDLVYQGADEGRLRDAARETGARTLLEDGLLKMWEGVTSVEELARVLPGGGWVSAPAPTPPASIEPDSDDLPEISTVELLPSEPRPVAEDADLILVVDDAAEIRELVKFTLQSSGYRVITANDGLEALEAVKRHTVSLVVLDVMMPGMTGFEVCQHLKQDLTTAFLPVLILSARGDQAHIKSGFRAGADDYLPKPFDPEELELRVAALLRRAYRGA